jgi:SAM-dependent methyltransferase
VVRRPVARGGACPRRARHGARAAAGRARARGARRVGRARPQPRRSLLTPAARDRWAEWLAERRFGGDPEARRRTLDSLAAVRDRVLDRACLEQGETLLDVGCGEGLVGFGALERGAATVVFADVSSDLLDVCRAAAADLGALDRCRFVEAPADDLAPVESGSIDVVTTRSVLIYVAAKAAAFAEFFRVLRPGGRISLFEPINRFAQPSFGDSSFAGYDLHGLEEIGRKLWAVFEARQPADSDPMIDFDERDLVRLAEGAGFFPVRATLELVVEPLAPRRWETFQQTAGNPNIPTVGEAMAEALSPAERERLTAHLRPLVEQGKGTWRMGTCCLAAVKPG